MSVGVNQPPQDGTYHTIPYHTTTFHMRYVRDVRTGGVACTGLHGANRLASTSLLEGLVWGFSIADHLADRTNRDSKDGLAASADLGALLPPNIPRMGVNHYIITRWLRTRSFLPPGRISGVCACSCACARVKWHFFFCSTTVCRVRLCHTRRRDISDLMCVCGMLMKRWYTRNRVCCMYFVVFRHEDNIYRKFASLDK